MQTVDKVQFKLTIPLLLSIIVPTITITAIMVGFFYKIQLQITEVNSRVAAIYERVNDGNTQHQNFTQALTNHETRISKLEGWTGLKTTQ